MNVAQSDDLRRLREKHHRERVRLINVAVAILLEPKSARLKVSREMAQRALQLVIQEAEKLLPEFDSKEERERREEYLEDRRARNREQMARRKLRLQEDAEIAAGKRPPRPTLGDVAKQLQVVFEKAEQYDLIMIRGKRIGDVYYHDLEKYRYDGAFEASLCDQILRHAIPNAPTKVRDMVKPDALSRMVDKARADAGERRLSA